METTELLSLDFLPKFNIFISASFANVVHEWRWSQDANLDCEELKDDRARTLLVGMEALLDSDQAYLPPDVSVQCGDGSVQFHRFILCTQSKFFQVRFTSGGPYVAPSCRGANDTADDSVDVVDLTHFSTESMEMLKKWIYTGVAPDGTALSRKLTELVLIGNYLMIPYVVDACADFCEWSVNKGIVGQDWVMDVYFLGQRLNEKRLTDAATVYMCFFQSIPENFERIDFEPFSKFIKDLNFTHKTKLDRLEEQPPRTMVRAFTSAAGLTALPRERFILGLVVKFLKHDRSRRLVHATALFKELRLAFLAKEIDFVALGLGELNDRVAYPELHKLLDLCAVDDDYDFYGDNPKNIPPAFFTPRSATVRYSLWSRRLGDYHLKVNRLQKSAAQKRKRPASSTRKRPASTRKCTAERRRVGSSFEDFDDNNNDVHDDGGSSDDDAVPKFKMKRFRFERGQSARITQIDFYPKLLSTSFTGPLLKGEKTVIAGIRLHWSDGTANAVGHIDEAHKQTCELDDCEGLDFKECCSNEFLERVLLYTNHPQYEILRNPVRPKGFQFECKTYGPFGKEEVCADNCYPMMGALLGTSICSSSFSHLLYLDGIKGVEMSRQGTEEKAITGLIFKFSLHLNNSMDHLIRKPKKRSRATPKPEAAADAVRDDDGGGGPVPSPSTRPKSLTIEFLKADNRYLLVSELRGAYIRQDRQLRSSEGALFVSQV